jgi:anionic cell wall polymer biosynthesis LytR-Cps2A-Psr (LCP) family protein
MGNKKKFLLIPILIITLILGASFTFLYQIYKRVVVSSDDVIRIGADISPSPTPTPDPLAPKNILLMGYAGGNHEGATLTDTIIIAQVDPRKESITLISIPRDLWVPIPVESGKTEKFKINAAFAVGLDDKKYPNKEGKYKGVAGAGTLAKETVQLVTGLKIDNFVAINFEGFKKVIDVLGTIDVNVPDTFEDKYYPLQGKENDTCGKSEEDLKMLNATMSGQLLEKEFTCRFETVKFDKGKVSMDSETALKFVRSRHSETNGNDFARSVRQQALLIGIKNKLLRLGTIPKIVPILNTVSKYVLSDIDIKTAVDIITEQPIPKTIEVKTISLSIDNVLQEALSTDRQYILTPKDSEDNWIVVHDYINEQLKN